MVPALLDTDERAACRVAADWLATSPVTSAFAAGLGAIALVGVVDGGSVHAVWLAAVLWLPERVLAVRVALDARLFARLADGDLPSLALLDAGLSQVLAVPAAKAGRPLAPRLAGALRLYRWHVASAASLLLAVAPAWFHRWA